jgi:DNA-directed RNA polymerase specialized sigma24 family protein
MTATDPAPLDPSPDQPADEVRGAFRDLHGRRLHGFALLLTLGDRPTAARLASTALAAGAARIGELRHPERAAAWLRQRVVEDARSVRGQRGDGQVLAELGADESVSTSIAVLDRLERAVLIASAIERLDRRDVAVIVGRDGAALDRLLRRARERYLRAHAATVPGEPPEGPIAAHVQRLARRALT